MIRQCFLTNTGIKFHSELLQKIGMDPDTLYPVVKQRPEAVYAPVFRSLGDLDSEKGEEQKEPKSKEKMTHITTLKFSSFKLNLPPSWTATQSMKPSKLRTRARSSPGPTLAISNSGPGSAIGSPDVSGVVSGSALSAIDIPGATTSKILTEEEEDLADALSPIYDQLKLKKAWWALEVIPMRHRFQQEDDHWRAEVSYCNPSAGYTVRFLMDSRSSTRILVSTSILVYSSRYPAPPFFTFSPHAP